MKTTCTVFGTPEQEKRVELEFEGYWVNQFYGNKQAYFVNFCRVNTELDFSPLYVKDDAEIGIAEALGIDPSRVRMECEVEFTMSFVVIESKITEHLFI